MPSQQSKQNRKSSWQALLCIAQSQAESGARDSSPASFSLSTVHVSVYPSWFGLTSIMELNVWVSIRYVKWFSLSSIWPNFVKKLRASRILWTLHTDLMVWQRIQNGELQVMQQICGVFFHPVKSSEVWRHCRFLVCYSMSVLGINQATSPLAHTNRQIWIYDPRLIWYHKKKIIIIKMISETWTPLILIIQSTFHFKRLEKQND